MLVKSAALQTVVAALIDLDAVFACTVHPQQRIFVTLLKIFMSISFHTNKKGHDKVVSCQISSRHDVDVKMS